MEESLRQTPGFFFFLSLLGGCSGTWGWAGGDSWIVLHIFCSFKQAHQKREHVTDDIMLVLQCCCEVLALPQSALSVEKGTERGSRWSLHPSRIQRQTGRKSLDLTSVQKAEPCSTAEPCSGKCWAWAQSWDGVWTLGILAQGQVLSMEPHWHL